MTFMLDLMMDVLACWIMPRRRQLGLLALLAAAVVVAFVVDDRSSLGAALYYLALATALVAALGLAHESGLWSKVAAFSRRRSEQDEPQLFGGGPQPKAAPRVQVPRPAGPVGPMPVLQKQPGSVTRDPIATAGPQAQPQDPPLR